MFNPGKNYGLALAKMQSLDINKLTRAAEIYRSQMTPAEVVVLDDEYDGVDVDEHEGDDEGEVEREGGDKLDEDYENDDE